MNSKLLNPIIVFFSISLFVICGKLAYLLLGIDGLNQSIAITIIRALLIVIVVKIISHDNISLQMSYSLKQLIIVMAIVVSAVLYVIKNIQISIYSQTMLLSVFFMRCLSVALFEELFFRIYLFSAISKFCANSIFAPIHFSALLFGLVHFTNYFIFQRNLSDTLLQVLSAYGLAILFHTIMLGEKRLLLVTAIHFSLNFVGSYKSNLLNIEILESESTVDYSGFGIISVFVILLVLYNYVSVKQYLKEKNYSTDWSCCMNHIKKRDQVYQ